MKIEAPVVAVHKEVNLVLFAFELCVAFVVRNLFDCMPVTATPIGLAHNKQIINQLTVNAQSAYFRSELNSQGMRTTKNCYSLCPEMILARN